MLKLQNLLKDNFEIKGKEWSKFYSSLNKKDKAEFNKKFVLQVFEEVKPIEKITYQPFPFKNLTDKEYSKGDLKKIIILQYLDKLLAEKAKKFTEEEGLVAHKEFNRFKDFVKEL